jgi:hypothetical protein
MYGLAIDTDQGAGGSCLWSLLLRQPLSILVSTSLFLPSTVISSCLHQTLHSSCEGAVKRANFLDGYPPSHKNNIFNQHNEVVGTHWVTYVTSKSRSGNTKQSAHWCKTFWIKVGPYIKAILMH